MASEPRSRATLGRSPWDVPGFAVRHVARLLQHRGISAAPVLAEAGLSDDVGDDSAQTVDVRKEAALLDICIQETGDSLFAMEAGLAFNPRRTTLLSYLFLNAADVETALEHAANYARLAREFAKVSVTREPAGCFLEMDSEAESLHDNGAHCEFRIGCMLATLRLAAASPVEVLEIRLPQLCTAAHADNVAKITNAKVRSSCRVPGLLISKKSLKVPIANADPTLFRILESHAQQLLGALPPGKGAMSQQVQNEIALRLPLSPPAQEEISRTLGMSVSTLARRLRSEGTTFARLLKDTREHLARHYLDDASLSLSEIAFALGYTDQAAFSNAYKKWTGDAPGKARRASSAAR